MNDEAEEGGRGNGLQAYSTERKDDGRPPRDFLMGGRGRDSLRVSIRGYLVEGRCRSGKAVSQTAGRERNMGGCRWNPTVPLQPQRYMRQGFLGVANNDLVPTLTTSMAC